MVARLLYRDGLMLVIDKPAGFAVHRGPKGGESLEDHFDALRFGLPRAPALAHRLDRDTSGCLVLGRHRKALAELGRLFKNGRVGKTYWAVVEGGPAEDEGRIDLPLGRMRRHPRLVDEARSAGPAGGDDVEGDGAGASSCDALAWSKRWPRPAPRRLPSPLWGGVGGGGRSIGRHGRLIASPPSPSLPRKGGGSRPSKRRGRRVTAQIAACQLTTSPGSRSSRSPAARISCACIAPRWAGRSSATRIYGSAPRSGGPDLHLHAREIVVPLYKNREPIRVTAPVPLHMHERLQACGWQGEVFTLV